MSESSRARPSPSSHSTTTSCVRASLLLRSSAKPCSITIRRYSSSLLVFAFLRVLCTFASSALKQLLLPLLSLLHLYPCWHSSPLAPKVRHFPLFLGFSTQIFGFYPTQFIHSKALVPRGTWLVN